jgi:hypothetical protein
VERDVYKKAAKRPNKEGRALSEHTESQVPRPKEEDTNFDHSDVQQLVQGRRPTWNTVQVPSTIAGPSRLSHHSQQQMLGDEDIGSAKHRPSAWTNVTTNDFLVNHLLALYFCWEYPTFASLSKEHFLLDYNSGAERFCSSLLVNAILAIGARLSDLVEVRMDPDDRHSAGDQFFNEAQRLLSNEATPTVITIQALNLMSLRQASSGNDGSGWHYARHAMRIALDLDLPGDDPNQEHTSPTGFTRAERQVRVATFWGCFALEQ